MTGLPGPKNKKAKFGYKLFPKRLNILNWKKPNKSQIFDEKFY